jgi:hypothetical protein
MRHHLSTLLLLALAALLMGCTTEASPPEDTGSTARADTNAQPDSNTVSDTEQDTEEPSCCPLGEPSCGGFALGGSRRLNGCNILLYDAAPSATNVTYSIDEDGCPYWKVGSESCLGGHNDDVISSPDSDDDATSAPDGDDDATSSPDGDDDATSAPDGDDDATSAPDGDDDATTIPPQDGG